MDTSFEYQFWFWSNKLDGIIKLLSGIADYEIVDGEIEAIQLYLKDTNDEEGKWSEWKIDGKKYLLELSLACGPEEGSDITYIKIKTQPELQDTLKTLDYIQSSLKTIDLEHY